MLITAAQFKEHYPLLTGSGENAVIETLIGRADGLLALFCGFPVADDGTRSLTSKTYTRYPKGPRTDAVRALELGIRPVISITSAHVDPDWDYDTDTEVAAGDMVVDGAQGTLLLKRSASAAWSTELRANKVVLVAGFAAAPDELVALAAAQVRHLWDLRRTQGQVSAQFGGDQVTYSDAVALIPESVRALLGPYILWESRLG